MLPVRFPFFIIILALFAADVRAELVSLDIRSRVPFAGGKEFGKVGPYEMITAIARFAVDPSHERNRPIVDLDLAPRNSAGKVEFACDVVILAPQDRSKGNGAIFYDVNNRGNKLALRFFNLSGGGNDLTQPGAEGDGFLMRHGFTVVWSGWIGELLPGDGRLRLVAPVAANGKEPIRGLVRFEMSTDKRVGTLPLGGREGHGNYEPTKEGIAKATLTVRDLEGGPRQPVPRQKWKLVPGQKKVAEPGNLPADLSQMRVEIEGGFEPGKLYELICECENPRVMGTGFASVRDLISFLRHDTSDRNPLRRSAGQPANDRAFAFGVSQSGRFLRHLLWQGFNEDEQGRIVFDGLIPHVAGGGLGFFNHRFAQPTRHNGQHENHTYPADLFPFTYGESIDPFTGRKDGILGRYVRAKQQPKVMHTQSAAEYWHRSGSLVHTDPESQRDADIPANVRIYAFGGTQHGPASDPPKPGIGQNLPNPGDYRPFLRSLLVALDAWVTEGKEPPASVYPRLADRTLVAWDQASTGFPKLPGIRYPRVIQQPAFCDHGPDFLKRGIITREPPAVKGHYTVLVPRSDEDGNDLGCLLPVEVAVPLATYTGWNLRKKEVGAEDQLANLLGSYIPFAQTKAEREKVGDPRRSLVERYESFAAYRERFARKCAELVRARYLLPEDADRLIAGREKVKKMFP